MYMGESVFASRFARFDYTPALGRAYVALLSAPLIHPLSPDQLLAEPQLVTELNLATVGARSRRLTY
jgi:hypothetical protein